MQIELAPRLILTNQGSVINEQFAKNGVQKEVHVVVKNIAFTMDVEAQGLDLLKANMSAKLIYDYDKDNDPRVEVSYVKNEPLDYRVNLFDNGAKAIVEIKIKVLTSQHEDMLFRVQLCAVDSATSEQLEVTSKPIKVISKLTHVKKSQPNVVSSPTTPTSSKKRLANSGSLGTIPVIQSSDINVTAALARIEQTQQNIVNVLSFIARRLFPGLEEIGVMFDQSSSQDGTTEISVGTIAQPQQALPVITTSSQQQQTDAMEGSSTEVEHSFRKFLVAVNSLAPEEKQEKISGLVSTLSSDDSDKLGELLDTFSSRKKSKTDSDN